MAAINIIEQALMGEAEAISDRISVEIDGNGSDVVQIVRFWWPAGALDDAAAISAHETIGTCMAAAGYRLADAGPVDSIEASGRIVGGYQQWVL